MKNIIPYMWEHSKLSYLQPTNSSKYFLINNTEEFYFFRNKVDFAYFAIYQDHIVISFEGTKNIKGWISNFDPYPLNGDEYNKKYLKNGRWGRGTIHDGFYTSWSFFKPCINKIIETYHLDSKDKLIFISGHSRGGALAELCSRHLAKNLKIENSCITFAAPACGTKKYRDQFRLLPINGTRIINGWDIVPDLPPKSFGFRHGCSNKIWIKKIFWKKWMPWLRIKDHYLSSYDKAIKKRFFK